VRIVVGNKIKEMKGEEFLKLAESYPNVEIDLGTGDGRFPYKNALLDKDTLFIGVDPSEKQLQIFSKKAVREKVQNLLYLVASFEMLPKELTRVSNKVHVILPWGTLLENIVKPTKDCVNILGELLRVNGVLEIILGYAPEFEPSETKRLSLPPISLGMINDVIIPTFESNYFKIEEFFEMSKEQLANIETTWAKKLRFGKNRKIYKILFSK
jgi:16S rRNA (adenine(1408)-N(1))-methyltransferase